MIHQMAKMNDSVFAFSLPLSHSLVPESNTCQGFVRFAAKVKFDSKNFFALQKKKKKISNEDRLMFNTF